jgi:hypothetical protein
LTLNESGQLSAGNFVNIYHLFLRYLFLNLRENNSSSLNSTVNGNNTSNSSAAASNAVNLVWRQFKGRLYTRLHDKRITELDLNGIINVAHLFFVLIKSFSTSNSLAAIALKSEQLESYFRILNMFVKARNLRTIEQILPIFGSNSANSSLSSNTISNRSNAIMGIFNTKFVAIKLWFESSEGIANDTASPNAIISEEIAVLLQQEFISLVNSWLDESCSLANLNANMSELKENHQIQPNQIASFKNAQVLSQFLSDFLMNYFDNCKSLLIQAEDGKQSNSYELTFVSCQLLSRD